MARSKAQERKAKAAYSRQYRKDHPEMKTKDNRKTVDARVKRNQARREMEKKVGKAKLKGKEVHHKDGNPKNNSKSNLEIKKKGHGGGVKGNKNAKKKK
jgi:hypothetical protein